MERTIGVDVPEIGVALIGGGFMAKAHAVAYATMPMYFDPPPARPVRRLLVDRDEQRACAAASRYGFDAWASDWRTAIEDPRIDVIDVVTPNHVHEEVVVAAVQAGKHVICEKPLAPDRNGARRMRDAAAAAGVVHATAFNFRRTPAVVLARQLLDEGLIGRVLDFRGTYLQDWSASPDVPAAWRFRRDEAGSGAIGDIGSHVIDFARYLVGEVSRVNAIEATYIHERPDPAAPASVRAVDVDDWGSFLLEFDTGARGSIEVSRLAYGRNNLLGFEIHGTEGTLQFDYEHRDRLRIALAADGDRFNGFHSINTGPAHPYGAALWPAPALGNGYAETKVIECYEFFRAIVEGRAADPSFEDGYRTACVADSVLASAREARWMEVAD